MQVLSSLSGLQFSAASAGFAPTNSADVSAIASSYQVVSSTGTQLHAGTAYLTGVNGAPISASRAGQAANASLSNSAYYDGTGRLISALPDSAAVSAIASSYAESAASGKQDTIEFGYDANNLISSIDGSGLAGQGGGGGGSVSSPSGTILVTDGSSIEATNSAVYLSPPGPLAVYTSAHPSVASAKYYGGTIYNCDDASGMPAEGIDVYMAKITNSYTKSASFTAFNTSWEEAWTGTASWNSANNMAQLRFGTLIDVVSLSWGNLGGNSYLSGSSTSNYSIQFLKTTQPTLVVGELAWASSLPTYGYDENSAISSINGSAIAAGGATGDYVEKSAWSVAIGHNNTATMTSFAQGEANNSDAASFVQGASGYAYNESFSQGSQNSATNVAFAQGASNSANLTGFAQGYRNTALTISFAAGTFNYAMNHSFAAGYYNSAVHSATAFGQYNLKNNGDTTGHSAAFVIGDGTASNARHDLMVVTKDGEITMYSSTADTTGTGIMSSIRALSANAGGVDSATVSAIASAYVESGVSSKLDSSASSDFYTTANESGFVDSAYVDSAVSGKMNASAIDYTRTGGGTQIYASGNGSSTNQFSAKNDSAGAAIIAGENARLRLWDTAATANLYASSIGGWNAASNLVSSQSANWGGSALQLSAGPGVKFEKSGNVLVASTDRELLWSGSATGNYTAQLSESKANFEKVEIWHTWNPSVDGGPYVTTYGSDFVRVGCMGGGCTSAANAPYSFLTVFSANNTAVTILSAGQGQGATPNDFNAAYKCLLRVYGINRTAEA